MVAALAQQRSASFHERGTEQRPKMMPDLLAGVRGVSFRSGSPPPDGDTGEEEAEQSSGLVVSVAVQQSMWPLHVMASAEWTVADLVAAAAPSRAHVCRHCRRTETAARVRDRCHRRAESRHAGLARAWCLRRRAKIATAPGCWTGMCPSPAR